VLYGGDCAYCVRWLHFWLPVLRRREFEVDTLQADWTSEALGVARDEILRDIFGIRFAPV
jgi:predicted DCC family thiol-disulfide oxidoreductase YuxK